MNLVYSQYLFDDFGEHLCFAQKLGLTFVFYDLYSELCKVKGVSLSRAAESMGLSRTSVVKWKAGSVPTGATLNKIAAYFGVSVDYLLGNEQKEKLPDKVEEPDITFDDFTYALHNETKELTDENRQKLLEMARFFKEQQDKKKKQ